MTTQKIPPPDLPNSPKLPNIDALAAIKAPYSPTNAGNKTLFERAMAESANWHQSRNENYRQMCDGQTLPIIPVGLFKKIDLNTKVEEPGQWLSSSGTGGAGPTGVFFDAPSLARIEQAMWAMFAYHGFFSNKPARFLLLTPNPREGGQAGYATAFLKFTAVAPVAEIVFAVEGDSFKSDLAWETLNRWSKTPEPVYIFGLTVFFERLLLSAPSKNLKLSGPLRGISGGGWKGLTQTLSRPEVIQGLLSLFNGPLTDLRDIYGLTEHPLHYLSCPAGHFHQPIYSRFFIMSPEGEKNKNGLEGLIRLQNPFYASLPAQDILTEDLGHWGEGCPCGQPGLFLAFHGRLNDGRGTCAYEAPR